MLSEIRQNPCPLRSSSSWRTPGRQHRSRCLSVSLQQRCLPCCATWWTRPLGVASSMEPKIVTHPTLGSSRRASKHSPVMWVSSATRVSHASTSAKKRMAWAATILILTTARDGAIAEGSTAKETTRTETTKCVLLCSRCTFSLQRFSQPQGLGRNFI